MGRRYIPTADVVEEMRRLGLRQTEVAAEMGINRGNLSMALAKDQVTVHYARRMRQAMRDYCWKRAAYAMDAAEIAEDLYGASRP